MLLSSTSWGKKDNDRPQGVQVSHLPKSGTAAGAGPTIWACPIHLQLGAWAKPGQVSRIQPSGKAIANPEKEIRDYLAKRSPLAGLAAIAQGSGSSVSELLRQARGISAIQEQAGKAKHSLSTAERKLACLRWAAYLSAQGWARAPSPASSAGRCDEECEGAGGTSSASR